MLRICISHLHLITLLWLIVERGQIPNLFSLWYILFDALRSRSSCSELFLKIDVPLMLAKALKNTCEGIHFFAEDLKL